MAQQMFARLHARLEGEIALRQQVRLQRQAVIGHRRLKPIKPAIGGAMVGVPAHKANPPMAQTQQIVGHVRGGLIVVHIDARPPVTVALWRDTDIGCAAGLKHGQDGRVIRDWRRDDHPVDAHIEHHGFELGIGGL